MFLRLNVTFSRRGGRGGVIVRSATGNRRADAGARGGAAQGGTSNWENCVLACVACNKHKADRTPAQAKMKLRKPPIRPTWKPLYADFRARIESWSKFLSEAYWNVKLEV